MKNNRFDEAMQCHHNAAELLLDAMKSTNSTVALESITLQHSYHLKQKDLIRIRKDKHARVKKAIDQIKQQGKDPSVQPTDNSKIQVAIYRTIYETDSLLDTLTGKKEKSNDKVPISKESDLTKDPNDGKKMEIDQQAIADEIQTLNRNLHSLVEQLVMQVEVCKDENMTLKERVKYLEKERTKYLNIQISDFIQQNNFSNISIGNEAFRETIHTEASSGQQNPQKQYGTGITRPIQQPHFDLSAFKDD